MRKPGPEARRPSEMGQPEGRDGKSAVSQLGDGAGVLPAGTVEAIQDLVSAELEPRRQRERAVRGVAELLGPLIDLIADHPTLVRGLAQRLDDGIEREDLAAQLGRVLDVIGGDAGR